MSTKELYKQKLQAQLDEWNAEIAKLKAKAAGESADVQIALHKQLDSLESHLADARTKLADLAASGDDAWESLKASVESAWDSVKAAFAKLKS